MSILLSLDQPSAHLGEEGVVIDEHGVDCLNLYRTWLAGKYGQWRETINDLERCCVECGVEHRVVVVFGPGQPLEPSVGTISGDAT
jgi:hypothetical protein